MKFIYLSNQVCLWKLSTEPMGKIWNLFKVQSSIDKFFVPHKQWIRASEETHFKILWVRSERCENILKGWGLKSQYVAQFVVIVNPRKNQKFKPTSSSFQGQSEVKMVDFLLEFLKYFYSAPIFIEITELLAQRDGVLPQFTLVKQGNDLTIQLLLSLPFLHEILITFEENWLI